MPAGEPAGTDGPGDELDQIQSVMSPPSLAAGAGGDAGAGILGWSGRLSGVGRVVMTSLAGTWGRSSAAGIGMVSRSVAGVPGRIMASRGEVMVPVSTSRRLMSSRTKALLDREATSARAVVAQQ